MYVTGVAYDMEQVLSALYEAAQSAGWTLDGDILSNNGCFCSVTAPSFEDRLVFQSSTDELGTSMSLANQSVVTMWPQVYHLFLSDSAIPYVYVVLTTEEADRCQVAGFGMIENQVGGWTGGNWSFSPMNGEQIYPSKMGAVLVPEGDGWYSEGLSHYATSILPFWVTHNTGVESSNSSIYCDLDGDSWCNGEYSDDDLITRHVYIAPAIADLLRTSFSWQSSPFLVTPYLYKQRADRKFSLLGNLPGLRLVRMEGFSNGKVVKLGNDRWMLFFAREQDGWDVDGTLSWLGSTGMIGYAIKYDGP